MKVTVTDQTIMITIEKGPDNMLYKWLQFNTKEKLTEAMQKSQQFDQLADSLKMIVGASGALLPPIKVNAVGKNIDDPKPLNETEILKKLKMF